MLVSLSIKNYALIDHLNVSFTNGFTVITGETGAGKSILLGGLALVLGKRADLSSLRDKEKKCVIEAEFSISKYNLKSFFNENDVDYEENTIIRREILPSGKSRAFINDSPVRLATLTTLGDSLIDVHSQNQTLQLGDNAYQFKVIDGLASNADLLATYEKNLRLFKKEAKALELLQQVKQEGIKEHDYNTFLLSELESAPLKEGILEELEEQYEQLNNVENIMEHLSKGHQLISDEQVGILTLLAELKQASSKLAGFGAQFTSLNDRVQSVFIEVDDIFEEFESLENNVEANPKLLEEVNVKLQLLYDLQKKHGVLEVKELLQIKEDLAQKVDATENIDAAIQAKEAEIAAQEKALNTICTKISKQRKAIIPELKQQLESILASLGMPSAEFKIEINEAPSFMYNGKDELVFQFSANKGSSFGELKKVASGGELSRIMLAIKAVLAKYEDLPTLMFDEIDTGVSGEISNRMGVIMQEMSSSMQIFSITHLPQVASKGNHHYKVYKEDKNNVTHTQMKQLTTEERVVELAEMLGGKDLSDSAIAHARQLLN
ncbi:DNA repair protein RecN [Cellulophaga lytica DSM 7489]|uniref:DNA repair protein RecN n=1 Tax=Cellulophaga lytica (strain ATCC 23178 / DSM 7489 / JCM 8516 / NBRC 14961 / NCIMB 1423 / VKM B-1433 / Cy l20) TaxID=867900 RepID=F0RF89_CELLC|nr:DNA repair protein RecN [Cellulophaga lytica]ADY31105.1 DNA repair protein RecN [Cellulophaga lytica DSM 7489]WQG77985.1 DNA repair protein RecN [Cellulophaga lytica]